MKHEQRAREIAERLYLTCPHGQDPDYPSMLPAEGKRWGVCIDCIVKVMLEFAAAKSAPEGTDR